MIKKLGLLLALLIIGSFASQGAFAKCNNAGVGPGDRWGVVGWCVDKYGEMWPNIIGTNSQQIATQGGSADPVILIAGPYSTYDTLSVQNTGNDIIDMAGLTAGSGGTAYGGEYILPTATPGLVYSFAVGVQATITIDTLTNADIILGPGTVSSLAGNGIKNTTKATADSITLVSPAVGIWIAKSYNGTWATTGSARVH